MNLQPNIVFIVADQLKWSALRLYSELGIKTPAIERLAKEGVTYKYAITPHPLCVPARTSMMTGRYPHSTGCRLNETLMPPNTNHAFKIWKDNNYFTGLIGKNHCFTDSDDLALFDVRCEISHTGLPTGGYVGENIGVQGMEWGYSNEQITLAHKTRKTLQTNTQSPTIAYACSDYPLEHYSSSLIASQSIDFFNRYKNGKLNNTFTDVNKKPFALMISFPDPHEPYESPREYVNQFPINEITLPPQRVDEFTDGTSPERNRVLAKIMRQDFDKEQHKKGLIATYYSMIRFLDDGIGRILRSLDDLDLRKNTIIVFTSDHGDFMGEHGMSVKGGLFYDCLVRVPLVISWPSGGVPQGIVDESMANTIDILPTLLQLQQINNFESDLPDWDTAATINKPKVTEERINAFHGKPLPIVTDSKPRNATFSEYGAGGSSFTMKHLDKMPKPYGYKTLLETLWAREAEGRRKMVRTKDWKYVTDPMAYGATLSSGTDGGAGNVDELYDLKKDPWELHNVAFDPLNASIISEMRYLLAGWMIETEDNKPLTLPMTMGRDMTNR